MKISVLLLFYLSVLLWSCNDKDAKSKGKDTNVLMNKTDTANKLPVDDLPNGLSVKYLGVYEGLQEGYNLRNENGEELEVRGEKIPVPSCTYKFNLKLNNLVTLQQTNMSNQQNIFYSGTYQVVNEDDHEILISCTVTDGDGSSPNYNIAINKESKAASCYSNTEPEFQLTFGNAKKGSDKAVKENEAAKKDSISNQESISTAKDSTGL